MFWALSTEKPYSEGIILEIIIMILSHLYINIEFQAKVAGTW